MENCQRNFNTQFGHQHQIVDHLNTIERQKQLNKQKQQQQQVQAKLIDQQQRTGSAQFSPNQTVDGDQSPLLHRRVFTVIYIYAILIITLYVTYAAYYFYQHQQASKQQNIHSSSSSSEDGHSISGRSNANQAEQLTSSTINSAAELENKLHLLERYIELIALDLEETKGRLKEREKCDCSISCSFNGTKYADQSTWQKQCDICTCQVSSAIKLS